MEEKPFKIVWSQLFRIFYLHYHEHEQSRGKIKPITFYLCWKKFVVLEANFWGDIMTAGYENNIEREAALLQ